MHPDMLGQMVQLEHTRRLHALDVAAALRIGGDDVPETTRAPRTGRVARLLAMRPHGHRSPACAKAVFAP